MSRPTLPTFLSISETLPHGLSICMRRNMSTKDGGGHEEFQKSVPGLYHICVHNFVCPYTKIIPTLLL